MSAPSAEPAAAGTPFISVIVPVYNDARRLRLCLTALERQSWPTERFEVLVIDNGSTPPLPAIDAAEFPHARLLLEPTPGVSRARHRGLTAARGEIIAFTDADCVPDPAWLAQGAATLAGTPNCGLVGGRIVVVSRDPARPNLAESLSAAMHLRQERFLRGHWAAAANAFTWRRVVDAVGPPKPELYHCEEIEWGRRVHAAGYAQAFAAAAVVMHPARSSVGELGRRAARLETAWQELRRTEGIGTGARAWLGQYLVGPLAAIGTDVLADRQVGGWSRRLSVAALAVGLIGVRLVAWVGQSLGRRPDVRKSWG